MRLSQSTYKARNLCQFVTRVSQEQLIRFTSHLTDLLLRSHKSAVLKLVQFGCENWEQSVKTTPMWSHGEADVNQIEISVVQHQFALVTCSEQEPNVKQVSVSGKTWSTRSNLQRELEVRFYGSVDICMLANISLKGWKTKWKLAWGNNWPQ